MAYGVIVICAPHSDDADVDGILIQKHITLNCLREAAAAKHIRTCAFIYGNRCNSHIHLHTHNKYAGGGKHTSQPK